MRRLHKIIGLILILPFLGWIITAFAFYFKPGYAGAYESLQPRFYPLVEPLIVKPDSSWLEFRACRTILGPHLLVRTAEGWTQLDPYTLLPRAKPTGEEIRLLLTDAFTSHPDRYGKIRSASDTLIITDKDIRIVPDWRILSFYQRGPDTDMIDLLYRIHYLQWTGIKAVDRFLGPLGLFLVFLLGILGLLLAWKGPKIS